MSGDTSERPESYWEHRECCANCQYSMDMGQEFRLRCLYGLPASQYPTSKRNVHPAGVCDHFKED